jgi:hypothetical protein
MDSVMEDPVIRDVHEVIRRCRSHLGRQRRTARVGELVRVQARNQTVGDAGAQHCFALLAREDTALHEGVAEDGQLLVRHRGEDVAEDGLDVIRARRIVAARLGRELVRREAGRHQPHGRGGAGGADGP